MTAWKYHWQSFQNGPKLATEKGTHHRPSIKGTWTAKKYLDIDVLIMKLFFFPVFFPCMSRGSHRELAINEGKSDEVQTEHLPSFPLLDVVIAEVYQEHGLTWRPLSPFTTIFGIRVWTIATAAGASGGRAKGGRVGRSGLGHFTSSQIKGRPNNQSQVGMVDFWDVLHDGIYLGMVQKAEISFESVQTDLALA